MTTLPTSLNDDFWRALKTVPAAPAPSSPWKLYWDLIFSLLQFSFSLSRMSPSARLVSRGMAKVPESSIPSLMVAAGTGGGGDLCWALGLGSGHLRTAVSFIGGNWELLNDVFDLGGGLGFSFKLEFYIQNNKIFFQIPLSDTG